MFGDNTIDSLFDLAGTFLESSFQDSLEACEAEIATQQRKLARLKKQKSEVAKVLANYRKSRAEQKKEWEAQQAKFKKQARKMHKDAAAMYGGPVMTVPVGSTKG